MLGGVDEVRVARWTVRRNHGVSVDDASPVGTRYTVFSGGNELRSSHCSNSGAASSSTWSAVLPGRPGRVDNASNAPAFALLQMVATVVRSTRHFAAASTWVYWLVSTPTNSFHFSLGGNTRLGLRVSLTAVDRIRILPSHIRRNLRVPTHVSCARSPRQTNSPTPHPTELTSALRDHAGPGLLAETRRQAADPRVDDDFHGH